MASHTHSRSVNSFASKANATYPLTFEDFQNYSQALDFTDCFELDIFYAYV